MKQRSVKLKVLRMLSDCQRLRNRCSLALIIVWKPKTSRTLSLLSVNLRYSRNKCYRPNTDQLKRQYCDRREAYHRSDMDDPKLQSTTFPWNTHIEKLLPHPTSWNPKKAHHTQRKNHTSMRSAVCCRMCSCEGASTYLLPLRFAGVNSRVSFWRLSCADKEESCLNGGDEWRR